MKKQTAGPCRQTSFRYGQSNIIPLESLTDSFLLQSLNCWNDARGQGPVPEKSNLDLLRFPPKVLPFTIVADVLANGTASPQFRYRYYGSGHYDAKGKDLTGSIVDRDRFGGKDLVYSDYAAVAERRQAMAFRHEIKIDGVAQPQEYIALRMPFSGDNCDVEQIVCVCSWWRLKPYWRLMVNENARG